jgi:predicted nucleic acid-binding protein
MLDTNILILRKWIDPAELPDEMAISAITWRNCRPARARSAATTSRTPIKSMPSGPVPFDAEAARIYGRVTAAVITAGRKPRGRAVDLMIAATAIAEGLPLYTTNPADFTGLDTLIRIVPVTRTPVPHERPAR